MNTDSSHLILDLWMEGEWSDEWVQKISALVEEKFTVVGRNAHQFEPHGETVTFILSESHYTLHSYPEEKYISIDIYICYRDYDFLPFVHEIESNLPLARIHQRTFRRGEYALPWLSRWKLDEKLLVLATFFVASCSLFYELVLAQTLSAILGDTAHRYNVTIGLYIASMGVGALLYEKINFKNLRASLIRVEIALALIGGISPVLALMWDNLWRSSGALGAWIISIGLHCLIILIGVLSGLELPLLMDMGEKKREGFGTSVLAFDYAGTLMAAIVFPLILLPALPLFSVAAFVATLNAIIGLLFFVRIKERISLGWMVLGIVVLLLNMIVIFNSESFTQWVVEKFYIGAGL